MEAAAARGIATAITRLSDHARVAPYLSWPVADRPFTFGVLYHLLPISLWVSGRGTLGGELDDDEDPSTATGFVDADAPPVISGWSGSAKKWSRTNNAGVTTTDTVAIYSKASSGQKWLSYGWWTRVPDSSDVGFGTFGNDSIPGDSLVSGRPRNNRNLNSAWLRGANSFVAGRHKAWPGDFEKVRAFAGTATYAGAVAGQWSQRKAGEQHGASGPFTADLTLTANFDHDTKYFAISGNITNFRDASGASLGNWDLMLADESGRQVVTNINGGALGYFGNTRGAAGDGRNWTGGWVAQFFLRRAADSRTAHPTALGGAFQAHHGTPERAAENDEGFVGIFGAFGAELTTRGNPPPPPEDDGGGGGSGGGGGFGGGGGGGAIQTVPDAPTNLMADATDGVVMLTWEAPEDDGGSAVTDYEYRINGRGSWTSIGSTDATHTVGGLVNGTTYSFQVRAVNRVGRSRPSDPAEATPMAPVALDFTHFANGTGITSEMVLVNVAPHPIRPAVYFYDTEGGPVAPARVVDISGDLEVLEDGGLTVQTAMGPLGQLAISTHGRGGLVSGSVEVLSDGPIGGSVRYSVSSAGVTGVGASPPVRDVLLPARRQEGGIRTAVSLHNLQEEAAGVNCSLMSGGVVLEEAEILLKANGQASWFVEEAFSETDTSDFLGTVRCTLPGNRRFTAIAVETDAAERIYTPLPVLRVDRTGGLGGQTVLDFAHFANGTWITDLVFLNLSMRPSGPPTTPFDRAIPSSRPAIYFYDTEGNPIAATSVVDVSGDLEVAEDGALTARTGMEPLGVLTISTHGRGTLVTGSVRVVSEGPVGGMVRFRHPGVGVAAVGASPPVSDAIFPVRHQTGGVTTGVAIHNLESSPGLVRCELMRERVLQDSVTIPLAANGQTSWRIDSAFTSADTSDFSGSVRCHAVGEGLFTVIALEMNLAARTFFSLPVVPLPEAPSQK